MTAIADVSTPALVVDIGAFEDNLRIMSEMRPGRRLRPHVKAHKCTSLAARQRDLGHSAFTCATPREVLGLAAAGLGDDILLANETVDSRRLAAMAACDASITIAVDSPETADAAARAGITQVLIDVNVGLPRCGCRPADAVSLAEQCVRHGLVVRGVMGYEGHLMAMTDRTAQRSQVRESMAELVRVFDEVRPIAGDACTIISAGGTGTVDLYVADDPILGRITEVQAGSYALMDTQYTSQGLPFRQAVYVIGTVISQGDAWYVADVGLKSLGMDHGNPRIPGASVWFCSDEHVTFSLSPETTPLTVGDRVAVIPAHVDPTVSQHDTMFIVSGFIVSGDPSGTAFEDLRIVETWPVDLRGW